MYGLSSSVATRNSALRQPLGQFAGRRLVEQQQRRILQLAGGRIEILAGGNFAAVDRDQFGLKLLAVGLGERAEQVPVRGRDEGHPLPLALDDQPHRHALHAAGRQLRPHLAPQQRRNFVAVQPIDDPPRFLGPHQIVVDLRADARSASWIASFVIS